MRRTKDFLTSFLVTSFVGAILLLMVYETWALFTGHEPITNAVRGVIHEFPGWALVIAIVIGMLLGHFVWGGPGMAALRQLQAQRRGMDAGQR
jgi:uncharacterized membrane protein YeaQ/YmgE (transglycosylase-associated protein family)